MQCPQCGWPDIGKMPAGVRLVKHDGRTVLLGHLIYVSIDSVLCSICEDMKSAVASKPWFQQAHREYLDQVKVKKRILRGT